MQPRALNTEGYQLSEGRKQNKASKELLRTRTVAFSERLRYNLAQGIATHVSPYLAGGCCCCCCVCARARLCAAYMLAPSVRGNEMEGPGLLKRNACLVGASASLLGRGNPTTMSSYLNGSFFLEGRAGID